MSKAPGEWQKVDLETEPWETTQDIQIAEWSTSREGRKFVVPIDCYVSNGARLPDADPIFIFPGYGEEEIAIRAAVRRLEAIGIPSVGVNLPDRWLLDRVGIERSSREAPQAAIRGINEILGKDPETPADVMGNSKGSGMLLVAGVESPEQFRAFGIESPIGVTNKYLGKTKWGKMANYFWRLGYRNNQVDDQKITEDPSNILAGLEISKRILID